MIGKPQVIEMHASADILTAQLQGDDIQIWAECFDVGSGDMENRAFILLGTGQPIDEKKEHKYIASIQQGLFVWHLFEVIYEKCNN